MTLDDPEIMRQRNSGLFRFGVPARRVPVGYWLVRQAESVGEYRWEGYREITIQLFLGHFGFGFQLADYPVNSGSTDSAADYGYFLEYR